MLLQGCESVSYEIPNNFDLSGRWTLNPNKSDETPDTESIWLTEQSSVAQGRAPDPTYSASFIVQDFPIVKSDVLLIEQDEESMGIQYQHSPYVDLKWGQQLRDGWLVDVGWNGTALVISKSRESIMGIETLKLGESGNTLEIEIKVSSKSRKFELYRFYEKE